MLDGKFKVNGIFNIVSYRHKSVFNIKDLVNLGLLVYTVALYKLLKYGVRKT